MAEKPGNNCKNYSLFVKHALWILKSCGLNPDHECTFHNFLIGCRTSQEKTENLKGGRDGSYNLREGTASSSYTIVVALLTWTGNKLSGSHWGNFIVAYEYSI